MIIQKYEELLIEILTFKRETDFHPNLKLIGSIRLYKISTFGNVNIRFEGFFRVLPEWPKKFCDWSLQMSADSFCVTIILYKMETCMSFINSSRFDKNVSKSICQFNITCSEKEIKKKTLPILQCMVLDRSCWELACIN